MTVFIKYKILGCYNFKFWIKFYRLYSLICHVLLKIVI